MNIMTINLIVYLFAAVMNLFAGLMMLIDASCYKELRKYILPGVLFIIAGIGWTILFIINL